MSGDGHLFGRSHSQVRELARLVRSPRSRRHGLAFVEGQRAVGAAVDSARAVRLVITPQLRQSPYAQRIPEDHPDLPVLRVTADAFRALSRRQNPSGMGAVIVERWLPLPALDPGGDRYWLAVSGSDYPGNLGCVIRSAVANGAAGVMLLNPTSDPYHPEALRAAMGATFAVPLTQTGGAELAGWARERGVTVAGVDPAGAVDSRDYAYPRPLVLLVGAERTGIAAEHRDLCSTLIRIPMRPAVDSLNVCAAASIIAYEAERRRPGHGGAGCASGTRACTGEYAAGDD